MTNRLILCREIMDAYSENHKKHMNILSEQSSGFVLERGIYSYHCYLKGWV
jgi:hypothetical protein